MNNKKFVLTVFALVTSADPLKVFLVKEGIATSANKDYEAPDILNLNNKQTQFTNFRTKKQLALQSRRTRLRAVCLKIQQWPRLANVDLQVCGWEDPRIWFPPRS